MGMHMPRQKTSLLRVSHVGLVLEKEAWSPELLQGQGRKEGIT